MSNALPPPLVPAEVDLTDHKCLWLDVVKLPISDAANADRPEVFRAVLLLRCAAWHQVPCTSLPDDDKWLAANSGAGRRWGGIRAEVLQSFVRCSDGRLYDQAQVGNALRAWQAKQVRMRKRDRRLEMDSGAWQELRAAVFKRDNYTCVYCGEVSTLLEADHVIAVRRGGPTIESNLVTACRPCNRSKGAKSLEDWLT